MKRGTCVLLVLAVAVVGQALTPASYITPTDLSRFKTLFGSAQPYAAADLESIYYSILGFSLLDEPFVAAQEACDAVKKHVDPEDVESLFYATVTANLLKVKAKVTCKVPLGASEKVLTEAISEEATSQTIYYAVAALKSSGAKVDLAKASTALTAALKKDDAALSHAYAFLTATHFTGADLNKFHDLIEDVIAQADEVDEKHLQFDGGVFTTAMVIDASFKLSEAAKKAPTLTEDKITKFANYLMSRKHVQQLKNGAVLFSVVNTLSDNQYSVPIAVTLPSQAAVTESNPNVQVRVSTLMGASLGKMMVIADTARHLGDDAVILSKKPFDEVASDSTLYQLDLMKVKPARGFYHFSITSHPQKPDKRLMGTRGAEVEVKVTTQVNIENVEIGVADKDQGTAAKTTMLAHPNKAANALEADHQQKIIMKFQLRDRTTDKAMVAHQTFVCLTNKATDQEIILVAEPDSANTYKFDLDVGANAKDFGYQSGKYQMDLIVGDSVIENPFSWTVADVHLSFQEGSEPSEPLDLYSKKPEIKHMFREPDVRPPVSVSNVFTGLVLLPLLLLILMWLKLGANISNFQLSVSAVGFHVGLGAIFGLYYFYWTKLTMFSTLRYLSVAGVPTFLFGNRLLSNIAAKRKV